MIWWKLGNNINTRNKDISLPSEYNMTYENKTIKIKRKTQNKNVIRQWPNNEI